MHVNNVRFNRANRENALTHVTPPNGTDKCVEKKRKKEEKKKKSISGRKGRNVGCVGTRERERERLLRARIRTGSNVTQLHRAHPGDFPGGGGNREEVEEGKEREANRGGGCGRDVPARAPFTDSPEGVRRAMDSHVRKSRSVATSTFRSVWFTKYLTRCTYAKIARSPPAQRPRRW